MTEGGARASLRLVRRGYRRRFAVEALAPAADTLRRLMSKADRHGSGGCRSSRRHHARPRRGRFRWGELPSGRSPTLPRSRAARETRWRRPGSRDRCSAGSCRNGRTSPYAPKALLAAELIDSDLGRLGPGTPGRALYRQPVSCRGARASRRTGTAPSRILCSRSRRRFPLLRGPACAADRAVSNPTSPMLPAAALVSLRQPIPSRAARRAVRTARELSRTVFGQRFQNPLLLAAGTAGFGRELDGVMDLDRLGGLVTKAVSREPRAGNPPPRVAEFRGGMLNSVGLANPGLDRVRSDEPPWLASRLSRARVIVNVVGLYRRGVRRGRGRTRCGSGDYRAGAQPVLSQHKCRGDRVRR